jgi:hypothetical protein
MTISSPVVLAILLAYGAGYLILAFIRVRVQIKQLEIAQRSAQPDLGALRQRAEAAAARTEESQARSKAAHERTERTQERSEALHERAEQYHDRAEALQARAERDRDRSEALLARAEDNERRWGDTVTRLEALMERVEKRFGA